MTVAIDTEVSTFIRALRKHLKLSQEKFALKLGISFPTLSRWERGKAIPSQLAWEKVVRLWEKLSDGAAQLPPLPDEQNFRPLVDL